MNNRYNVKELKNRRSYPSKEDALAAAGKEWDKKIKFLLKNS